MYEQDALAAGADVDGAIGRWMLDDMRKHLADMRFGTSTLQGPC